jgi:hypothetical protein
MSSRALPGAKAKQGPNHKHQISNKDQEAKQQKFQTNSNKQQNWHSLVPVFLQDFPVWDLPFFLLVLV